MNRFEEYVKDFNTKVSIGLLLRIALLFLIVLLVKQTWPIWSYVLSVLQSILTPFLIGFPPLGYSPFVVYIFAL